MKKQMTSYLRVLAMVAFCATMLVIAMGVGRARTNRIAAVGAEENRFLFTASEIIHLGGGSGQNDSDIARLDTRTGAVYRFRGNVDVASVTNTWELRVPAVTEKTSGLLEIQNILPKSRTIVPDAFEIAEVVPVTFLVDIVYGTTWILRETSSSNARWQLVDIYRSAQFK